MINWIKNLVHCFFGHNYVVKKTKVMKEIYTAQYYTGKSISYSAQFTIIEKVCKKCGKVEYTISGLDPEEKKLAGLDTQEMLKYQLDKTES